MHVRLFVIIFHTHSLSTGWCLWRSDLRSDLSSFSLYLSCLWCPLLVPLPLSPQLQLITVCSFYYCLIKRVLTFVPEWETAAPLSCLQSQTEGWQQFDYPQFCPLLFSFYTFPAKCTVFCVLLQCSVVCVLPCVHMIDKTSDTLINTCTAPRSLLFLCLRYHHYQHHHWGHCRLHPLPRPHTGCDSLVLQVSVSGALTFLHDNWIAGKDVENDLISIYIFFYLLQMKGHKSKVMLVKICLWRL